jgi:hypothetical protein
MKRGGVNRNDDFTAWPPGPVVGFLALPGGTLCAGRRPRLAAGGHYAARRAPLAAAEIRGCRGGGGQRKNQANGGYRGEVSGDDHRPAHDTRGYEGIGHL